MFQQMAIELIAIHKEKTDRRGKKCIKRMLPKRIVNKNEFFISPFSECVQIFDFVFVCYSFSLDSICICTEFKLL